MRASNASDQPILSPATTPFPGVRGALAATLVLVLSLSFARDARADDLAEFRTRRSALAAKDVAGRLDLADWCLATARAGRRVDGRSFRERAAALFTEALALAPQNARAHRGLGHVFIDGKWEDSAAARADEARRLRRRFAAAGLVTFAHGWETKEGAERRRAGLVYAAGMWRTPEQARAANGYARIDGKWVEPRRALSIATGRRLTQLVGQKYDAVLHRHVIWVAPASKASLVEQGTAVNKAVDDLLALTGRAGAASPFPWPARVVVLGAAYDVSVFEREYDYQLNMAPAWGRPAKDGTGIRAVRDRSGRWLITVHLQKPSTDGADVRALAVHGVVRAALDGSHARAPFWLTAGLAGSVQAIRAAGHVVTTDADGRCAVTESKALASSKALRAALTAARAKNEAACSLQRLISLRHDDATTDDRLLAVAFVMWMTGHHPGTVGRAISERIEVAGGRTTLERIAGKPLADLQSAFDGWVNGR